FYFVLSTHTATSESLSLSLHDALPIFLLRAYASGHAPGRVCAAFRAAAPRLFQSWRGPRQARSFSTLLPAAWVREYLLQAEAGTASVWEHLQREQPWFVCRPPLGRVCRA